MDTTRGITCMIASPICAAHKSPRLLDLHSVKAVSDKEKNMSEAFLPFTIVLSEEALITAVNTSFDYTYKTSCLAKSSSFLTILRLRESLSFTKCCQSYRLLK